MVLLYALSVTAPTYRNRRTGRRRRGMEAGTDQEHPAEKQNGIAVFSRTPMRRTGHCPAPAAGLVRWPDIDLPEYGFGIAVLHIIAAGSSKTHPTNVEKTRFWEVVLRAAQSRLQEPFLFVGDWNTGAHRLDETGKTFVCAEHFGRLARLGWTDMWRHHHPGITEYTSVFI
jgi:exonuclease III